MPAVVADTSEKQLLDLFLPVIEQHNASSSSSLVLGPGDDSSVLDLRRGLTVMSIDTLTENQDFRRHWPSGYETSGYDVGFKAATQNLADIAAMGAEPTSLLVSLSLPGDLPVNWVLDFARGLTDSCREQGAESCSISGGDLGRASEISVTVTAVGLSALPPIQRSTARNGDVVAVSGRLGAAACGLSLLETPADLLEGFHSAQDCIRWQSRPAGALRAGMQAGGVAHAMMDVSDGLVRDAGRIAAASGVEIDLAWSALKPFGGPLTEAAEWLASKRGQGVSSGSLDVEELLRQWVLTGGEDHAMLATFAPDEIPENFIPVGVCRSSERPAVLVDGEPPKVLGWDHFAS